MDNHVGEAVDLGIEQAITEIERQILDFMVARYGNFVLYEPPVNSLTYLLWYGPAVLVLIGALVVIMMVRSRKRSSQEPKVLNESDRERLDKLLKK